MDGLRFPAEGPLIFLEKPMHFGAITWWQYFSKSAILACVQWFGAFSFSKKHFCVLNIRCSIMEGEFLVPASLGDSEGM